MEAAGPPALTYQRAQFKTQLPLAYRYSTAHAWLHLQTDGQWRVGITKFASRMLGEIVDHGFHVDAGTAIEPGQLLGWIEGFKAVSDLHSVAAGRFSGGNAALKSRLDLLHEDPYGAGWLYTFEGQPDPRCLDAMGYTAVLDRAIDCLIAHRHQCEETTDA